MNDDLEYRTKVCATCHRELPIGDFYKSRGKDGHRNDCKHCFIEKQVRKRKNDPDHKVKHRTEEHALAPSAAPQPRRTRRANGMGSRHDYHARRYAENREAISLQNKVRRIERQLGRSIDEMPEPTPKPTPVKLERLCEKCVNWPCFDGIENLESDFAREGCQAFRNRGEVS